MVCILLRMDIKLHLDIFESVNITDSTKYHRSRKVPVSCNVLISIYVRLENLH